MSIFQSHNEPNIEQTVDKKAFLFGLMSVFLCGIGFSIITPVVPFLVQPYISNPKDQAIVVTLLTSVYAACVFFAAPGLGALSDRYGRRPLLLVCLWGSAIGYLVWHRRRSVGTVCRAHHRRDHRRKHQHDLRLFRRHHPQRTANQILWVDQCNCGRRRRHRAYRRRITCQVWVFHTYVLRSSHHFTQFCLWNVIYA